LSSIPPPKIQ